LIRGSTARDRSGEKRLQMNHAELLYAAVVKIVIVTRTVNAIVTKKEMNAIATNIIIARAG
jgi:hypothetical protein